MTYFASDKVPYDEWFDPNYKYEPHPYDNWPMAKDPIPDPIEETMHEKMYKIATDKYNPFSVGGSENIHDFDHVKKHSPWPGGSEEWQDSKPG